MKEYIKNRIYYKHKYLIVKLYNYDMLSSTEQGLQILAKKVAIHEERLRHIENLLYIEKHKENIILSLQKVVVQRD